MFNIPYIHKHFYKNPKNQPFQTYSPVRYADAFKISGKKFFVTATANRARFSPVDLENSLEMAG